MLPTPALRRAADRPSCRTWLPRQVESGTAPGSLSRRRLLSRVASAALLAGGTLLSGCGGQPQAVTTPVAIPADPATIAAPTGTPVVAPTATTVPSPTVLPLAVSTATAHATTVAAVATPPAVPTIAGPFVTAVPTVGVSLMAVTREYCYYLKEAMVSGNIGVLWQRYPALQRGASATRGAGINVESYYVDQYRPLHPFDGDMSPEAYAPIKVKLAGDRADILVHGWQSYLWLNYDNSGKSFFDMSGWEFVVQLLLQRRGGAWTVVQTVWPGMGAYTGRTGPG